MTDQRGNCVINGKLGSCPEHAHTLERLAMLEKGMEGVELSMKEVVERLTTVRDQTMREFVKMREGINEGILKRIHPLITLIITLLFGAVCTLATILIEHALKN